MTSDLVTLKYWRWAWDWRHFTGYYNDQWYESLFLEGGTKIKGEITPAYCLLRPQEVRHISQLMPKIKIIFLLREPIDRTWSAIRFRKVSHRSTDFLKEFIEGPKVAWRNDYARTLEIWNSCFPKEQIFVGYFEDIVESPHNFLNEVFKFLGARPVVLDNRKVEKAVNSSRPEIIPPELELYLAEKFLPDVKILSEMIGGRTIAWLKKAETILLKAEQNSIPNS